MSDYLMVPVKYSILSVTNKNERQIYIPVATKETPGIVSVGKGLSVDYYGVLSVEQSVLDAANDVTLGDIVAKGFYGHLSSFKYPKDAYVFSEENRDIYQSLVENNEAPLDDDSSWRKTNFIITDAKEIAYDNKRSVADVLASLETEILTKVNKKNESWYIDNDTNNGLKLSYDPGREQGLAGAGVVSVAVDPDKIVMQAGTAANSTKMTIPSGGARPKIKTQGLAVLNPVDSDVATLSDLENKQNKKPDGTTDLINEATGKINNAYIPVNLSGGRVYAGSFKEDGIIASSVYASEIDGQNINEIDIGSCVGYEFLYAGETEFELYNNYREDELSPYQVLFINKNDLIVCNGNIIPTWTIFDNSDKVVSVNGQTGAVQLDTPVGDTIETIEGTEDKPINLATDLMVGRLYVLKGKIAYQTPPLSLGTVSEPIVVFKSSETRVIVRDTLFDGYRIIPFGGIVLTLTINAQGYMTNKTYFSGLLNINGMSAVNTRSIYAPSTNGTSGQILQSNGGSTAPTWVDANFATLDDINNAIGNVSALLGDTEDLEV